MRSILKEQILINSNILIQDLRSFAKQRQQSDKFYNLEIPKYDHPIHDILKYRFIEEEVRCGQYYLRVWT
jgi:hypothetical protein